MSERDRAIESLTFDPHARLRFALDELFPDWQPPNLSDPFA